MALYCGLGSEGELTRIRSYVWFPVVDAVHRVRGSLIVSVPPRRNCVGPVPV